MDKAKIEAFAKSQGYDEIEHIGLWKGFDVYTPVHDELMIVGLPYRILVKGDLIRMTTYDEVFEVLRTLSDDE